MNAAVFALAGALVLTGLATPALADSHQMHAHDHGNSMASDDAHDHDHDRLVEMPTGMASPTVALEITADPVGGWNLHVITGNFRFAPEHASADHVVGEGHAHLYVDGKKIARLYGDWFHLATLPAGTHELSVTLNTNDHDSYGANGKPVAASVTVSAATH